MEEIASEFQAKRQKLSESQRKYNRTKKWTKPILIVSVICLGLSSLLPFLAPILAPIMILGLVVLLVRWVIYRFVFKDPQKQFNEVYQKEVIPHILPSNTQWKGEKFRVFETTELNDSRLFYLKADKSFSRGQFVSEDGRIRVAFSKLIHEKYTFKTFLRDTADDIVMSAFGVDEALYEDIQSMEENVFFSGMIATIKVDNDTPWMSFPAGSFELYHKKNRYPEALFIQKQLVGNQRVLFPKDFEGLTPEIESILTEYSPLYVLRDKQLLWVAYPMPLTPLKPEFDYPKSTDVKVLESGKRFFEILKKMSDAVSK